MAEKSYLVTGQIIAPNDIDAVASGLAERGWPAIAREDTANPGKQIMECLGEPLSFRTRPLSDQMHQVWGLLKFEIDGAKPVEKLIGNLQELHIQASLTLMDSEGKRVIKEFGPRR